MRMLVALILAPLVAPLSVIAVYVGWWFADAPTSTPFQVNAFLPLAAVFLGVAYVLTFAIALPAVLWLMRHDRLTGSKIIGLGTVIGFAPVWMMFAFSALGSGAHTLTAAGSRAQMLNDYMAAATWSAFGAGCGAATAAVFWLLLGRGQE